MPDDLYDRDIMIWSEQQADLLRRVARGERVNGVDWAHVVEEIEDVGLSQLNAVSSFLRQMLVHLLKLAAWPDHQAAQHWREEVAAFQAEAVQRFAPSVRQRLELPGIYRIALKQIRALKLDRAAPDWPATCPLDLDLLLTGEIDDMERVLAAAVTRG